MHRTFVILLVLFFAVSTTSTGYAADAVVGTGTTASCTETAFSNALASVQLSGGGTVTFNCGGAATIAFSTHYVINSNVTINGGSEIALEGANTTPFFQVFADASLTLDEITLQRGGYTGIHPLENFGSLTLDEVTLRNTVPNASPIRNSGTLTIGNSTFSDNGLTGAGSTTGGVIYNDGGNMSVTDSTFSFNIISGNAGMGGAIAVPNGIATISGTTFANNRALNGGALYIGTGGSANVRSSEFRDNLAGYGGAIESNGIALAVEQSTFTGNRTLIGEGGAIWLYNGTENRISESEFTGNVADATRGGAVGCLAAGLDIISSTFSENHASTDGGALYSTCTLGIVNSTLVNNNAANGGGALFQAGSRAATLQYTTIADNSALFGAGIYNDGAGTSTLSIGRSVVAHNQTGNCGGVIASVGYNLTNDTGCGAFTETGDVQNANLPLLPLGAYGGFTRTRPPGEGSDALESIPAAQCALEEDQRGMPRPQGTGCDSGAVEGTNYRSYMPLILRDAP